jgi:hypothetical protein
MVFRIQKWCENRSRTLAAAQTVEATADTDSFIFCYAKKRQLKQPLRVTTLPVPPSSAQTSHSAAPLVAAHFPQFS